MTIQTYPPTKAGESAALAVSDPKNVTFTGGEYIVRSGADYISPPEPSQDDQDRAAAKAYAKLNALKSMTTAQVQDWVKNNVTNLAQAQEAIATLAIAVSILARDL